LPEKRQKLHKSDTQKPIDFNNYTYTTLATLLSTKKTLFLAKLRKTLKPDGDTRHPPLNPQMEGPQEAQCPKIHRKSVADLSA